MYQFVHVESYSRSSPKTAQHKNSKSGKSSSKSGGHCVKYIVDEATRADGAHPHVDAPAPPILHYGKPLDQLEVTCEAWASTMTDSRGHKLRKDALCLAAGIVSAPHDIEPEAWEKFRSDSIAWLKEKYGDALESVVEHTDESHPHLHFYVVPKPGQRFESIHQGRAAAAAEKGQGGKKGEQNQAYKAAMREFQDEFFDRVGIQHGFTRIGPGKRRLTREEWKLEQIQAAAAAKTIAVAEATVTTSKVESQAIKQQAVNDAKVFADKTLKKADQILKAAESKGFASGFNKGIESVEQLPWWKKVGLYLSGAVRERDKLKVELETTKGDSETWKEKAKRYFGINKQLDLELKEVKPKLLSAEEELSVTRHKAKQAALLREENDQLTRQLGDAEHKIGGLQGRVEALKSMVDEQESAQKAQPVARRYEHEEGLSR
ncbi:plasmid recombination protein [Pseudomonas bubulae]|uniref:plasmid recombination protein n=1 Tax=Pseudomonas bubulae TaxID=2316085 RepID=UPI003D043CA4